MMRTASSGHLRWLSVLVAAAASAPIAACGGRAAVDDPAGSSSSGSAGRPMMPGEPGASSGGSAPSDCGRLVSATYSVDQQRCEPQLSGTTTYDDAQNRCGNTVCQWSIELPCTAPAADGGADDDGGADGGVDAGDEQAECQALCKRLAPANTSGSANTICRKIPNDASGGYIVSCGGCGVGRPPKDFVPAEVRAFAPEATWLAQMAQLEAASVHAFDDLHADLARLGAPSALLRDVLRARADEVRHARLVARQAERLGAVVPLVSALPRRSRTIEEMAVENAEQGCVSETFGAVVAAIQAEHASDPAIRRLMRAIAGDELRHAALSWAVAEWLDAQLSPAARARIAQARVSAVATLEAELAKGGAGLPLLGLPSATEAQRALGCIREALTTGELHAAA